LSTYWAAGIEGKVGDYLQVYFGNATVLTGNVRLKGTLFLEGGELGVA